MQFSKFLFAALLALAGPAKAADAGRGAYLAILGDCAGCHTVPKQAAFSGGLAFTAPFGTLYSTNITPDAQTGIGSWTADQFYRALHEGIAADGRHLYPAFPYPYFARLGRADTDDLFAFLKTQKPVHRAPTPNRLIFPFNLRAVMMVWNALYLDTSPGTSDPGQSAAWNRGRFLVKGLGHCDACHTPKNIMFGDMNSYALTGATLENWFAANLTGNRRDGLGIWSQDDVVQYLKTGHNVHATAVGSMQEKVDMSTSHMTDADRAAIATYLKSLAPHKLAADETARREQMARGQGVYRANCARCHDAGVMQGAYPQLKGDTLVMGRDPTTVLRVILQGGTLERRPGDTGPKLKPMPDFAKLGDGDVADVATYIRNGFGNKAAPVDADFVFRLRQALAANPD